MCLYHDLFGIAEDFIGHSNQLEQVHEILWGIYLRDVQGEGPGWWGRLLQRPLGETITRAIDESHQEFIFICDCIFV